MLSAHTNHQSPNRMSPVSACRNGLLALALLVMTSVASAVEVYLLPVAPVGYETNEVPATMKLVRSSSGGTLTVRLSLNADSVATLGTDFTVAGTGIADVTFPTPDPLDATDTRTTLVTMPDGESEVLITITPDDDALVEARESLVFTIKPVSPATYVIGAPSSMSLTIADNDHKARIQVPDPVADEDSALFGLVSDPDVQRRAVMRVRFDEFAAPADEFTRNLAVQFVASGGTQPLATLNSDYTVHYKICGNNGGLTEERSRIGYDKVNIRGTGLGYTLIAHLAGETAISISGATSTDDSLPAGSTLRFGNHSTIYTVTSAGPSGIVLSAGLTANLPNGTTISVLSVGGGGTADPPTNLVVQRIYPAGTTSINVDFGSGGLFTGDVFQIDGHDGFYVVTSDTAALVTNPAGSSGVLNFRRYQGAGTGGGLEEDTGGSPVLITHIEADVVGGVMQVLVPEESTKVEISVTPSTNGDGAEGVEEVRMRMIADEDYEVLTPQESSVFIADRDVSTNISVQSNAGLPAQTGYFKVTFSTPFSRAISVPYLITDTISGTAPDDNDQYEETILSSVTLVAGQTEALIQVDPIVAAGPASVTLTLIANLNYKLAGSTSSGVNPSATMDIANSVGSISIAATTGTANESATAPTNGQFTLTVARNTGQTGAIGVTLNVAGTAVVGSRYELLSASNTVISPVSGQIQVTIPSGQNTTTVGVRPINNFLADGNQIVQLTVVDGPSYLVGAPSTASVTVDDDEPTVSVEFSSHAARPSTPGFFEFSYDGAALSQAVLVNFTYGGTAVLNTDFTAATSVTIPSGSNSVLLAINPIDTAEGTAETVSVTVTPSTTYNIGAGTADMEIRASDSPSGSKPTPGTVNSGSSSGCGLGSGFATFALLGLLAFFGLRRRDG
jgi:hypothetical protein